MHALLLLGFCLSFLNSLLAEEPSLPSALTLDTALVETLRNQKEIQISFFEIIQQRGVLQQSAGPFDPLLTENVQDYLGNTILIDYPNTPENNVPVPGIIYPPINSVTGLYSNRAHFIAHDIYAQGSLVKKTRLGTIFTMSGMYEYFEAKKLRPTRASQVLFSIDQPLLRNFLNGIERQAEIANQFELQAAIWDSLQVISTKINNTVAAYWEVVAGQQNVKIYEESIERLEKIADFTNKLIKGEQLGAEDLNQVSAVIDTQTVSLYQAEELLYAAKQNLLFAMGVFDDKAIRNFEKHFTVNDTIPLLNFTEKGILSRKDAYIDLAFAKRFDVLAGLTRVEASEAIVVGAENATLPQFDVIGSVVVNDLNPSFQSVVPINILLAQETANKKNWSTNYTIGVSISVPLFNDAALGNLTQQRSINTQNILQVQLLKQSLINMILQTIYNQSILHQQWREAENAANKYKRLVDDELQRLQAGFGSVFVLLSFETSYTNTLSLQLNYAKQYIQGIAQLRYLTGTLIDADETLCQVTFENVLSYP